MDGQDVRACIGGGALVAALAVFALLDGAAVDVF